MLPIFDRKTLGLDSFKPYLKRWEHLACEPDFGVMRYFWPKFTDVEKDYWHRKVQVNDEQIESISNEPQDTELWLDYRFWRITMSNASHFIDCPCSNFGSLKEHLEERFASIDIEGKRKKSGKRKKNQKVLDDGHKNEALAREELLRDLRVELRKLLDQALSQLPRHTQHSQDQKDAPVFIIWEGFQITIPDSISTKWQNNTLVDDDILTCKVRGLKVLKHLPFLGASSDGELTLFGTYRISIEIKCPSDPKKLGRNIYTLPKVEHFFQTQGCMFHESTPMTLYMVRAAQRYTRQRFVYDKELCEGYLLPNWTNGYCTLLFPQLVKRAEQMRLETLALQTVFSKPPTSQEKDKKSEGKPEEKMSERDVMLLVMAGLPVKKTRKRKDMHDFFQAIASS